MSRRLFILHLDIAVLWHRHTDLNTHLDKVSNEALQGFFPTEDRSCLGGGEVECGMCRGCGDVSTDDRGYGEVGKVEVCRDEEVQHTELKCEAHCGEQVRGMTCTKHGEAITG